MDASTAGFCELTLEQDQAPRVFGGGNFVVPTRPNCQQTGKKKSGSTMFVTKALEFRYHKNQGLYKPKKLLSSSLIWLATKYPYEVLLDSNQQGPLKT